METIAQCGKIKPKFKQRKRVVETRKRIDCTQPKCFALQWDYIEILVTAKSQHGGRIKSNKIAKMHFALRCLAHIFVRGGETGTFPLFCFCDGKGFFFAVHGIVVLLHRMKMFH